MKKIVYSLILLLSVSCSSAATQSTPIPEKKVETASQAKVTKNQSKDFLSFVMQWRNDARWLLIINEWIKSTIVVIRFIRGPSKKEKGISVNLPTLFCVFLVVTSIAATLSTYLHFMNEEKEVKGEERRLALNKYFYAKWIPILPVIAFEVLLYFPVNERLRSAKDAKSRKKIRIIFVLYKIAFVCLVAAPITPYLTSYLKLTSDDTIKPQKKAQKFSFLKKWISYSNSMIVCDTILTVERVCVSIGLSLIAPTLPKVVREFVIIIISAITIGLSAWIPYAFEKEKMPSEQKTFRHHFFHNSVPMLLVFLRILFSVWYKKKNTGNDKELKRLFILSILYKVIYGMIIAPILVAIERYMVTKESVQRDSSKKSREEAQSKADII